MIESCSGSAGSNEILYTYETEVAAYVDLEDAKLVLLVPDILYGIAGIDTLPSGINYNPTDIRLLCKDAYLRILSLNISEPLGKMSFFTPYSLRIRIKYGY